MARITLKNFEVLIVSEEEANMVLTDIKSFNDDLPLSYSITHDNGIWVGTLKDIGPISFTESKRSRQFFLTEENKEKFHNLHGYGKYQNKYEQGYGLLDVQTQYLIGAGVAKLVEDSYGRKSLITQQSPDYNKYDDYWQDYLTKLDSFNEPN